MNAKLVGLLTSPDEVALATCQDDLSSMGYTVITDKENYVFGIPNTEYITPVMLLAHVDTCRKSDNVAIGVFADTLYNANAAECGCLGADDRAGVYIVLSIAERLKQKPYVLFTTGEESGYTGMAAFLAASHPPLPDFEPDTFDGQSLLSVYEEDIYCALQYDRQGMSDVVTYGASSLEYQLIAKAELLGYIHTRGSTSDSRLFSHTTKIAHLNLSAGFAQQHTENELLVLPALDFAINNGVTLAQMIDRPFRLLDRVSYTYPPRDHVGPPVQKDAEYVKPLCDVCDKHRKVTYIPEIMACVCKKCLRRIYKKYDFDYYNFTVSQFRQDLEAERTASKASNLPFMPSCPVMHSHEDVTPLDDGMFFCDECGTYFWQYADGVYWWDTNDIDADIWHRFHSDPVTIHEVLLTDEQCPLGICQICGKIKPDKSLAYYANEAEDYSFVVCDECNMIDKRERRKSNGIA